MRASSFIETERQRDESRQPCQEYHEHICKTILSNLSIQNEYRSITDTETIIPEKVDPANHLDPLKIRRGIHTMYCPVCRRWHEFND